MKQRSLCRVIAVLLIMLCVGLVLVLLEFPNLVNSFDHQSTGSGDNGEYKLELVSVVCVYYKIDHLWIDR